MDSHVQRLPTPQMVEGSGVLTSELSVAAGGGRDGDEKLSKGMCAQPEHLTSGLQAVDQKGIFDAGVYLDHICFLRR